MTWEQLLGGSPNPFESVTRTADGTYTASNKEFVVTDAEEISLPSPTADGMIAIRGFDQGVLVNGQVAGNLNLLEADHTDVAYFVSDGSGWYPIDGSLASSAIPDSAIAQYDAQALSASDGDAISTWPDEINGYDVSGGSPTYQASGINGYPALSFDGADDNFSSATDEFQLSQPVTYIFVQNVDFSDGESHYLADGNDGRLLVQYNNADKWRMYGGSFIDGSSGSSGKQIIAARYDGANSVFREDSTQTGSGDAGANSLDELWLGSAANGGNFYEGIMGEFIIYDAALTNTELSEEESRLADKWGITL